MVQSVVRLILSAFFVSLVAATFAISFATILYRGELAVFLDQGIALTLLGTVVIALVGAATLSYKGSILGPQDVPAILIASGAAGIVAQHELPAETLFATLACLVAVTTIITGALGVAYGRLRLAHVTRYFPYPVLAGFLATTGLLLLRSGLELALGGSYSGQLSELFVPENLVRWGPTLALALSICVANRRLSGSFVLPVSLIAALLSLFAIYLALGYGSADLRAKGLLLGPFQSGGFAEGINPAFVFDADWSIILANAPAIVTVALSGLIGMTLNASGLELALKREFDPNKEAQGSGLANILAGLFGGLPGYHMVGQTLLANRLGLQGALAGVSAASGCAFLFLFGGGLLNHFPVAFFGALVAYLGVDLLYSWLWVERDRFRRVDYAIVLAIPLVAVTFGFLSAIAVGLLLCAVIFILEYSRVNIVRVESDLSGRSSRVERPASDLIILERERGSAKILELTSFIFFGSSQALRSKVQRLLVDEEDLRWLILDFRTVSGLDVSALHVLERIQDDCDSAGVDLILSGFCRVHPSSEHTSALGNYQRPTLHACIAEIEEIILDEEAEPNLQNCASAQTDLAAFFKSSQLSDLAETITYQSGEVVIAEASETREVYVLLQGKLQVVLGWGTEKQALLATVLPGAVVGEMAYYTYRKRSATILAQERAVLGRLGSAQIDRLEQDSPHLAAKFHRLIAASLAVRLGRSNGQIVVSDP